MRGHVTAKLEAREKAIFRNLRRPWAKCGGCSRDCRGGKAPPNATRAFANMARPPSLWLLDQSLCKGKHGVTAVLARATPLARLKDRVERRGAWRGLEPNQSPLCGGIVAASDRAAPPNRASSRGAVAQESPSSRSTRAGRTSLSAARRLRSKGGHDPQGKACQAKLAS